MQRLERVAMLHLMLPLFLMALAMPALAADNPRVIEITAGKDARFKVAGQKDPVITVTAGEVVTLKITSQKGPEWEKDGAVHSFTIKGLKDLGWDLRLKEGVSEHTLMAPDTPGEYEIVCLVKCGPKHETMKAKLIVKP